MDHTEPTVMQDQGSRVDELSDNRQNPHIVQALQKHIDDPKDWSNYQTIFEDLAQASIDGQATKNKRDSHSRYKLPAAPLVINHKSVKITLEKEQTQFSAAAQNHPAHSRDGNSAAFKVLLGIVFVSGMILVFGLTFLFDLEIRRVNSQRLATLVCLIMVFSVLGYFHP